MRKSYNQENTESELIREIQQIPLMDVPVPLPIDARSKKVKIFTEFADRHDELEIDLQNFIQNKTIVSISTWGDGVLTHVLVVYK